LLTHHLGRHEEAEAAYRTAIELDPKDTFPLLGLGYLSLYYLEDLKEAEAAYQKVLMTKSEDLVAASNLLALHLIQPSRQDEAESAFDGIASRHPPHGASLLCAIRALARDNFGEAAESLKVVFSSNDEDIFDVYQGFFLLALRLAARHGYGEKLLAWLDEQGLSDRLWPLRVAFDAHLHGETRLMDVNPEVRGAAKRIFDLLDAPRRHAVAPKQEGKPRRRLTSGKRGTPGLPP